MSVPLQLPHPLPKQTTNLVNDQFMPPLDEVHFLLGFIREDEDRNPFPLVWALTTATVSLLDAVSYWFDDNPKGNFVDTVTNHYPWKVDPPPTGYTKHEVAQDLYEAYRNRFIHRMGAHVKKNRRTDRIHPIIQFTLKSTVGIDNLANAPKPIRPLFSINRDQLILNLDTLYWGLRRIAEKLLSDQTRHQKIEDRIKSRLVL